MSKSKSPFADSKPVRPSEATPPVNRVPFGRKEDAAEPPPTEIPSAVELATEIMPEPMAGIEEEDVIDIDPSAPKTSRAERIPFGGRKPRLAAAERPGYYRRWFNDLEDRLAQALAAGYAHVKDDRGRNVQRPGGTAAGQKFDTFLMELPMEWRNDDLEARTRKADELDQNLLQGAYNTEPDDGRYVPSTGIKVGVTHGTGKGR